MADLSTPIDVTTTAEPNPQPPGPENPNPDQISQPDSFLSSPSVAQLNPNPSTAPPPPVQIQPYPPSFRPVASPVPLPTAPQFSPLPNQNNFTPSGGVQPPGVSPLPVPQFMPPPYGPPGQQQQPQQINPGLRPYVPMPNGYPQGSIPPPDPC